VGFKPTYDVVSRAGVLPLAWSLDHVGPMARTVEDAALLFGALADDDVLRGAPWSEPPVIGVPDRYFEASSAAVAGAMREALVLLSDIGCRIRTVTLPRSFEAAVEAARVVLAVEASSAHQDGFTVRPDDYGPHLHTVVEAGRRVPAPDYVRAQRVRRLAVDEISSVFAQVDVLVTPTVPAPAPKGLESTGDPSFNTPFSSLGLPALAVPVPSHSTHLPVSLQIVASHGRDAALLAFGRHVEQRYEADGWSQAARRKLVAGRGERADTAE